MRDIFMPIMKSHEEHYIIRKLSTTEDKTSAATRILSFSKVLPSIILISILLFKEYKGNKSEKTEIIEWVL